MQFPPASGSTQMQVQKLPTGIEGFDDVCQGGLPIGRSTLISGTSGTGKTVFSLHFLHNGIKHFDEPGIFVTFEESPLDILRNAASFGWNLQEMVEQDKLFILDASPDPDGQDVAGSFDLSGLIERINYAIRSTRPSGSRSTRSRRCSSSTTQCSWCAGRSSGSSLG